MSQQDFDIATADANTGLLMRAAINAALQALASNNSAATAPGTTYPFQFWADTTSGFMKIRNAANNAWIQLFPLAVAFTSSNIASAPVCRDGNGDFAARIITAALTGNVTGNVSGSAGSCTGAAASAAYATNAGNADTLDGYHAGSFALTSAFPASFAAAGYAKVQGGLILQWGTAIANVSSVYTNFPIAFPNALLSVVAQSTHNNSYASFNIPGQNYYSAYFACNTFIPLNWIALGY